MAITTYSELQTAVSDWAHRSDITATIQDCIALAESRFNMRLRTKEQEVALTSTAINSSYQVSIPANTLAVKRMWRTGTPVTPLQPLALESVLQQQANRNLAGYYAMGASELTFDGTGTVAGVLYRTIPALSSTATTNWLLTSHPRLYLYATLAEVARWTRDAEMFAQFDGQTDALISELHRVEQRDEYAGPLTIRSDFYGA